jgi:ankyrin repeat protein
MLLSIWGPKWNTVISILRWVAAAFRPLTLAEIGTALELPQAVGQDSEDATKDFIDYAGDLPLAVRKDSKKENSAKIVVPVHSSVTDLLWNIDASETELAPFRLQASECHQNVAQRTLNYTIRTLQRDANVDIANPEDAENHWVYRQLPLLHYALTVSMRHLLRESSERVDLSHDLFDEKNALHQPWLRAQCFAISSLWVFGNTTLIHVAALLGHLDLMQHFIRDPRYEVDLRDEMQRTPLFYAILRERSDVVKDLLRSGADVNARDFVGQQPIHIAYATESTVVVSTLLATGADFNSSSLARGSSWWSDKAGSILDADRISGEDAALRESKDYSTGAPLHFAAEYNQDKHIRVLLDYGADLNAVDEKGNTPLHRMAGCDPFHTDAGKLLIKAGIDMLALNDEGETAFHIAARDCDNNDAKSKDLIDLMLDAGFLVDHMTITTEKTPGGVTALQVACGEAARSLVLKLIKRRANTNHRDNRGRTPLHWLADKIPDIAHYSGPATAPTLLRKIEEWAIFVKDNDGRTALDRALSSRKEYNECLAEAERNIQDCKGGFFKSWVAGYPPTLQKTQMCHAIKAFMDIIQLPLPAECGNDLLKTCPRSKPTKDDLEFCEIIMKNVSIYAYSGVARFITDYVTGGYIFALYDRLINQPTSS